MRDHQQPTSHITANEFREYGFVPDFCHGADPQSKGIVENLCGYAQDDLAVPLLTEAALAGERVDLQALNAHAEVWCAEINATVHSEICAVPNERLVDERTVLAALPLLRPTIGSGSVRRKVDTLSCIRYGSARYSVPQRLVGAIVAVVVDHGALIPLDPVTGAIVAEHGLVGPGETSILDEQYDGPPKRSARPPPAKNGDFYLAIDTAGAATHWLVQR